MLGEDLLQAKPTKRQREAKILTLDIERRMGAARFFDLRTDYIPPRNVLYYPSNLCLAWKWLGSAKVEFASVWDDGREQQAQRIWDAVDAADIIVTYNGVRFDIPHLRDDWTQLRMPEPRPAKQMDLYREVRRSLGFESKSLDEVCKRFGIPGKAGSWSSDLAEACIAGDANAQAKMRRYNINDVRITERLYLRMLGWLPSHPIVGSGEDLACCQCGSTDLTRNGWYRAVVQDYALYRCGNCAANVRSNFSKRVSMTRNVR